MRVVNANTKFGKDLIARGTDYEGVYLDQVYDRYSKAKQDAWNRCYELCHELQGDDFGIVSHNSFMFCVSFFTSEGMHYITPTHDYLVVFDR